MQNSPIDFRRCESCSWPFASERLVDLLPIAQNYYYHPSQEGSWSIKALLPAVVPELDYGDLQDVRDGTMAMNAFVEAIHPATLVGRKADLERSLLEYCKLDTYAMVRIWQAFQTAKSSPFELHQPCVRSV